MVSLSKSEGKVMLRLFKDFSQDYNANSLSKEVGITPRGTLKILKRLEAQELLISKQQGRAVFYKVNLDDKYVSKIVETLLIAEARENAKRWIDEFREVYQDTEIVLIFGSIIKNPKMASDVDVLFVFKKGKYDKVANFVSEKNKILFKKIHEIPQTMSDLKENLNKKNKALIDAVSTGYVLHGQDKLIEIVKNVTSF